MDALTTLGALAQWQFIVNLILFVAGIERSKIILGKILILLLGIWK